MSRSKSYHVYDPSKPGSAPRITDREWETHRGRIAALHSEGRSRNEIREILNRVGFRPSESQLRRRMERWELSGAKHGAGLPQPSTTATNAEEEMGFDASSFVEMIEQDERMRPLAQSRPSHPSEPDPANQSAAQCSNTTLSEDEETGGSDLEKPASQISSTPPLTLAETVSTDNTSPNERKSSENAADAATPHVATSASASLDDFAQVDPDSICTSAAGFTTSVAHPYVVSSPLLSLWPASETCGSLTRQDIGSIHRAASFFAATSLYDDAFDLFYIEYRHWQSCISGTLTHDGKVDCSLRLMVTATINCARNCSSSCQQDATRQMLMETQGLLNTAGLANTLDMVLLDLYRSSLPDRCNGAVASRLKNAVFQSVMRRSQEQFVLIVPGIQTREHIMLANSLRSTQLSYCAEDRLHLRSQVIDLQVSTLKHLPSYEHVRSLLSGLLRWCEALVQTQWRSLNAFGDCLPPAAARSRVHLSWIFYCCAISLVPFCHPLQFPEGSVCQPEQCTCHHRLAELDIPVALVVFSRALLAAASNSFTDKRRLSGLRLGDYLRVEINTFMKEWALRGPDLAAAYLSQLQTLPMLSRGREPLHPASCTLLREYLKSAFRTPEASRQISWAALTESATSAFSSQQPYGPNSARHSMAGSIRSSIKSIRSSMSLDRMRTMADMIETKNRMRRPFSTFSTWSRDTKCSNAMSLDSDGANHVEDLHQALLEDGGMMSIDEENNGVVLQWMATGQALGDGA